MKSGLLLSALIAAITFTSAFAKGGSAEKETRDLKGFDRINFGIAGDLYINIGPEFKVVIEADRSFLDEIKTEVTGSKLVIKHENWHPHFNERATIYITMPEIEGLGVSGSGKAELMDPVKSQNLDLSVSGSGKILSGDLTVTDLKVAISGSGDVIINGSGEASNADISISGSGSYSGESLKLADADFRISGSGGCKCYVTDKLKASVSGSGNITYSGNPRIDARVSGSGHVRSR
jgi:hypothetical protein